MKRPVSSWLWGAALCGATSVVEPTWAVAQEAEHPAAPSAAPAPRFVVPGAPESASAGRRGAPPVAGALRSTARPRAGKATAVVTFPGFRLLPDGRSRVFVELTKPVAVEERRSATQVTYTLRGAAVPVRNNRNALVTTHFATAVARARLVRVASDVALIIDLRAPVAPTHDLVTDSTGGARLEVNFPAGNYPIDARTGAPADSDAPLPRASDDAESPPSSGAPAAPPP